MKFNLSNAIIGAAVAIGSLCIVGVVVSICYGNTISAIACALGICGAVFVGAGLCKEGEQ